MVWTRYLISQIPLLEAWVPGSHNFRQLQSDHVTSFSFALPSAYLSVSMEYKVPQAPTRSQRRQCLLVGNGRYILPSPPTFAKQAMESANLSQHKDLVSTIHMSFPPCYIGPHHVRAKHTGMRDSVELSRLYFFASKHDGIEPDTGSRPAHREIAYADGKGKRLGHTYGTDEEAGGANGSYWCTSPPALRDLRALEGIL